MNATNRTGSPLVSDPATHSPVWQFWIDVGGTFTDCLALSPSGTEQFTKVLSSGIVKGRCDRTVSEMESTDEFSFASNPDSLTTSTAGNSDFLVGSIGRFIDDSRRGTVDDFWTGAVLRSLDAAGAVIGQSIVQRFSAANGEFELEQEIGCEEGAVELRYELDAGLPAPVLAIHLLQGIPIGQTLNDCRVDLGTTRGTNALLTRTGARTALITSHGFRDFLRIGDQTRSSLFQLTIHQAEPLFETAIEIHERVLFDGTIELTPDAVVVTQQLQQLKQAGIESIAICLMFGYQFPQHEQLVARLAAEIGFTSIRCSSSVAPVIKIVPRGETTVLDAYLDPVIATYLNEVQNQLTPASRMRFMTSGGGLVSRGRFSGKDSVLSGPAGGVVGAARIAQQAGLEQIIGFDMGGTSTDVCRFDGEFSRSFETRKAGVRIMAPMLDVETVAAGGGSICWFDGTKLRVGPQSAGADPGPACYGRGGPLAMTDVNLFLGRLQPGRFPFQLDWLAVERRLAEVRVVLAQAGHVRSPVELAAGFLKIANHNMAAAVQSVSVAQGFDPRQYALVSFGGAGSQHCCDVADNLGMSKILDHAQSSILSAVGIRLADQSAHVVESLGEVLQDSIRAGGLPRQPHRSARFLSGPETERIQRRLQDEVFPRLESAARAALQAEGNDSQDVKITQALDLRYLGTEAALTIPGSTPALSDYVVEFFCQHQRQFGYLQDHPVEIVAARVDASVRGNRLSKLSAPVEFQRRVSGTQRAMFSRGRQLQAEVFDRTELVAGDWIIGPAVIADRYSTTIVDSSWEARVLAAGVLLLEKSHSAPADLALYSPETPSNTVSDPVQLEIFNNHFSSIAGQMGIALQKTSVSVNVKERLDFSCAIFTGTGDLVVNAPHIPVHLGAMSETVRSIIALNPVVLSGDVFVTNDPYAGGSHLPDVTVVTPVFDPSGMQLWFWVASRSHHAEIGGSAPGSMPASAKCLGEEGVLIQNFRLIEGQPGNKPGANSDEARSPGEFASVERFAELKILLTQGRFPSRSPAENLADLRAQVAANQTGLIQLRHLVERYTFETVTSYMGHIQHAAEQKSRAALRRLPSGECFFADALDNGATIRVRLIKQDDTLTIDFAGTDPVLDDNLNANRAIVSAATMYVLRLLIAEDIPLNEGVIRPVTILLPECFLNPTPAADPFDSPAIVGGNVETSQRIVDCLLGAIKLAAASQGTMNNWLMGGPTFGYYETVGGGAGATQFGRGADAVHSHMTNTRLTDPEILESRYPVVLREFAIRHGSGGAGRFSGGQGMIREIEFRQPLTVSLLTSRRVSQPYGMAGGKPGAAGINQLTRCGRLPERLPSRCEIAVDVGDRLRMETPGGGGWGPVDE